MQHQAEPGVVAVGRKDLTSKDQLLAGVLESSLFAQRLREVGVRPRLFCCIPETQRDLDRIAIRPLRVRPSTAQFQHLAEPTQHAGALLIGNQRQGPLEVVDGRIVGVARLSSDPSPHRVLALLGIALPEPVVVRQQIEVAFDRQRAFRFEICAHSIVEV